MADIIAIGIAALIAVAVLLLLLRFRRYERHMRRVEREREETQESWAELLSSVDSRFLDRRKTGGAK